MSKRDRKWKGWALGILIAGFTLLVLFLALRTERQDLDDAARREAPGEFIDLPLGTVHYQLDGPQDGPLIVLVHGFSVPLYVWDRTAEALAADGFQVLRYDLYGRGYSDRLDAVYGQELFLQQLEELLTGLNKNDPLSLVGLSMGGPISADYVNRHPEQVSALVLIAPEVSRVSPGDIFPLNLPLLGEYLMAVVMEPILLPRMQAGDFVHPENYPGWEAAYRNQLQFRGTGRALLSTVRNLPELDSEAVYQELSETGVPLLLIWGVEDQTIGRDQVAVLEELFPDLESLFVEDAGHLPQIEQSEIVNAALLDFLGRSTLDR